MMSKGTRAFRRNILFILCGILLSALVCSVAYLAVTAGQSNRYKKELLIATAYAQYAGEASAVYQDKAVRLSAKNIDSLYEQASSGVVLRTFGRPKHEELRVEVDLGEGHTLSIWPTERNEVNYVRFTYEGRTRSFLVKGNSKFHLIERIVSANGLVEPNEVKE